MYRRRTTKVRFIVCMKNAISSTELYFEVIPQFGVLSFQQLRSKSGSLNFSSLSCIIAKSSALNSRLFLVYVNLNHTLISMVIR